MPLKSSNPALPLDVATSKSTADGMGLDSRTVKVSTAGEFTEPSPTTASSILNAPPIAAPSAAAAFTIPVPQPGLQASGNGLAVALSIASTAPGVFTCLLCISATVPATCGADSEDPSV